MGGCVDRLEGVSGRVHRLVRDFSAVAPVDVVALIQCLVIICLYPLYRHRSGILQRATSLHVCHNHAKG